MSRTRPIAKRSGEGGDYGGGAVRVECRIVPVDVTAVASRLRRRGRLCPAGDLRLRAPAAAHFEQDKGFAHLGPSSCPCHDCPNPRLSLWPCAYPPVDMAEPSWQETLRLRLVERNARESSYAPIIEQCMSFPISPSALWIYAPSFVSVTPESNQGVNAEKTADWHSKRNS